MITAELTAVIKSCAGGEKTMIYGVFPFEITVPWSFECFFSRTKVRYPLKFSRQERIGG